MANRRKLPWSEDIVSSVIVVASKWPQWHQGWGSKELKSEAARLQACNHVLLFMETNWQGIFYAHLSLQRTLTSGFEQKCYTFIQALWPAALWWAFYLRLKTVHVVKLLKNLTIEGTDNRKLIQYSFDCGKTLWYWIFFLATLATGI